MELSFPKWTRRGLESLHAGHVKLLLRGEKGRCGWGEGGKRRGKEGGGGWGGVLVNFAVSE